jgi:hypothetical protein
MARSIPSVVVRDDSKSAGMAPDKPEEIVAKLRQWMFWSRKVRTWRTRSARLV